MPRDHRKTTCWGEHETSVSDTEHCPRIRPRGSSNETAGYRNSISLLWGHSVFMGSTFIPCTLSEAMLAVEAHKNTVRSVNSYCLARSAQPWSPARSTLIRGALQTAGYRDYIPLLWGHAVFMVPTFIPCTLAEAILTVEAQKPTARSVNPHRAARSRGRLHASEGLFKRLEIAIASPCCGVTLYLWCPPSSHVPWLRPCWQ